MCTRKRVGCLLFELAWLAYSRSCTACWKIFYPSAAVDGGLQPQNPIQRYIFAAEPPLYIEGMFAVKWRARKDWDPFCLLMLIHGQAS